MILCQYGTEKDIECLRIKLNNLSSCAKPKVQLSKKCDELLSIMDSHIDELKPKFDELIKRVKEGEQIESQNR